MAPNSYFKAFTTILISLLIIIPTATCAAKDKTWKAIKREKKWNVGQYYRKKASNLYAKGEYQEAINWYKTVVIDFKSLLKDYAFKQKKYAKLDTNYQLRKYREYEDRISFMRSQISIVQSIIAGAYKKLAKNASDKKSRTSLRTKAGIWYWQAATHESKIYKMPKDRKMIIKRYKEYIGRFEDALSHVDFKAIKDNRDRARLSKKSLSNLADMYLNLAAHESRDNIKGSIKAMEKARKYYSASGNTRALIDSLIISAAFYEHAGKNSKAVQMYQQAAKLSDKLGKNVDSYKIIAKSCRENSERLKYKIKRKKLIGSKPLCLNKQTPFNMPNLVKKRKKRIAQLYKLIKGRKKLNRKGLMTKKRIKRLLDTLPCSEKPKIEDFCYPCFKKEYPPTPKVVQEKVKFGEKVVDKLKDKKKKDELAPFIKDFKKHYNRAKKEKTPIGKIRKLKKYLQKVPKHIARHLLNEILSKKTEKQLEDGLRKELQKNVKAAKEVAEIATKYFNKIGLRKTAKEKAPKELKELAKKWAKKGVPPNVIFNSWNSTKKVMTLNAIKFCLEGNPNITGEELESSELAEMVPPEQLKRIIFKQQSDSILKEYFSLSYQTEFILGSAEKDSEVNKIIKKKRKLRKKLNALKQRLRAWNVNVNDLIARTADLGSKIGKRAKKKLLLKLKKEGKLTAKGEKWYDKVWKSIPRTGEALWYLTAGNIVIYSSALWHGSLDKGYEIGADFIDARRKLANSCYGSPLGTDRDLVNKDLLDLGLAVNPLGQLGKGVGGVFEGLTEGYIGYASWMMNMSRKQYDKALKEKGNWMLKGGYYGWKAFLLAGSAALYLHMGGFGKAAQMKAALMAGKKITTMGIVKNQLLAMGSMIKSSAGMSFFGALGQAFLDSAKDGKSLLTKKRIFTLFKRTTKSIADNVVFMSLMSAAGGLYGRYVKSKYLKLGKNPALAAEIGAEITSALDVCEAMSGFQEVIPSLVKAKNYKEFIGSLINFGVELYDMGGDLKFAKAYDAVKQGINRAEVPLKARMSLKTLNALTTVAQELGIKLNKKKMNALLEALLAAEGDKGVNHAIQTLLDAGLTEAQIQKILPALTNLRKVAINDGKLKIIGPKISSPGKAQIASAETIKRIHHNIHKARNTHDSKTRKETLKKVARYLQNNVISESDRIALAQELTGLSDEQMSKIAKDILETHEMREDDQSPGTIFEHSQKLLRKKMKALQKAYEKVGFSKPEAIKKADALIRSGLCGNTVYEFTSKRSGKKIVGIIKEFDQANNRIVLLDGSTINLDKVNFRVKKKNVKVGKLTLQMERKYKQQQQQERQREQQRQRERQQDRAESIIQKKKVETKIIQIPTVKTKNIILSDTQRSQDKRTAWDYLKKEYYQNNDKSSGLIKNHILININGDLFAKGAGARTLFNQMVPGNFGKIKTTVDSLDLLARDAKNNPENIKILLGNHDLGTFLALAHAKQTQGRTTGDILEAIQEFTTHKDFARLDCQGEPQSLLLQQMWTLSEGQLDFSSLGQVDLMQMQKRVPRSQAVAQKINTLVQNQMADLKRSTDPKKKAAFEKMLNKLGLDNTASAEQIQSKLAQKSLRSLTDRLTTTWDPFMNVVHKHGKTLNVHAGVNEQMADIRGYNRKFRKAFREAVRDRRALRKLGQQFGDIDKSPLLISMENEDYVVRNFGGDLRKFKKFCQDNNIEQINTGHAPNEYDNGRFEIPIGPNKKVRLLDTDVFEGEPQEFKIKPDGTYDER